MVQLRYVGIDYTNVGDAGLEHLKGATQLEELLLHGTKITDATVKLFGAGLTSSFWT